MKKILIVLTLVLTTLLSLTGCDKESAADSSKPTVVKLGVTGDDHRIWDIVKEKLKTENIDLQFVSFSDYTRPNIALAEKEIDLNSFQHHAYFENFKKERKLDLVSLGDTVFAPIGLYSNKLNAIDKVEDNAKIAVPNDATNLGRALILLDTAGLIKLKYKNNLLPTIKDIVENPRNFEIVELVATQIPRALEDVDLAVINSGVAIDAKLSPSNDSLLIEDSSLETSKPYINLIASRSEDSENEIYKKVVDAYQSDEVKKEILKIFEGSQVPAF